MVLPTPQCLLVYSPVWGRCATRYPGKKHLYFCFGPIGALRGGRFGDYWCWVPTDPDGDPAESNVWIADLV